MKRLILLISLVLSVSTFASYTYVIDSYGVLPDLSGTQTMLITGNGGGGMLDLEESSSVIVENTSILGDGTGGVWQIRPYDNSNLSMSGGGVHEIDIHNNATATLSGGLIQQIWSYQSAWQWQYFPEPPVLIWNPHITIVYSGYLPTLNPTSHVLTGLWGNGTGFSIYLPNITGYSPAIENIQFQLIPEPASLILLAVGGLLLRRKKRGA